MTATRKNRVLVSVHSMDGAGRKHTIPMSRIWINGMDSLTALSQGIGQPSPMVESKTDDHRPRLDSAIQVDRSAPQQNCAAKRFSCLQDRRIPSCSSHICMWGGCRDFFFRLQKPSIDELSNLKRCIGRPIHVEICRR